MEQIFEQIFLTKGWLAEGTVSGLGSTVKATQNIRDALLKLNDISLCDVPCGDMNWMKEIYSHFDAYYGIDIVKPIVAQNTLKYANNKAKFMHGNICDFDFKPIDCSMIFVRDCFVHLSYLSIISALKNICNSNANCLMMTHFTNNREFIDIADGQWRPINFCNAPFNFPEPIEIVNEGCLENNGIFADKSMAIWTIDSIKKSLQNCK